jgi:glycosyltransferase involved in cell wall biosynthesis
MGAKVYHFEWIDDFGAAKSFAMDKANGNWIAILDADEYIPGEDMGALMEMLEEIQGNPELFEKYDAISCPRWNLDAEGKVGSVIRTGRFFKNRPDLRYKGRIHEQVTMDGKKRLDADNVRIMHTGYLGSEVEATGKAKRNIGILRKELEENPDNLNLKAYLADSLWMDSGENNLIEAHELFTEVINGVGATPGMKKIAFSFLINRYINDPEMHQKCEELCIKARGEFPEDIDFKFFHGAAMNSRGEYQSAFELLKECPDKIDNIADYGGLSYVSANPLMLFNQIIVAAQGMGDIDSVVKYVTIVLTADKTQHGILSPYIAVLLSAGKSEEEILDLLSRVYNITSPEDLMLIARAAKDCGAAGFARMILVIAGEIMNG